MGQACIWAGLAFVIAALGLLLDEVAAWVVTGLWPEPRRLGSILASSAAVGETGFLVPLMRLPVWLYLVVAGVMLGLVGLSIQHGKPANWQ